MENSRANGNRVRVGAVSYLNSKPLVYQLDAAIEKFATLSYAVPSKLADDLTKGRLDVGLIPAIEYFRHPERVLVSDACIACRGPVWSVQVLFRKAPHEVRTLAIDEGSRTSVALTQILLAERCGVTPETMLLPLSANIAATTADAVLVIGDRAMHLNSVADQFVDRWDLGQAWLEHTGLPFVFAAWVAQPEYDYAELARALSRQRDAGLSNVDSIAKQYAPEYGLTEKQVVSYLTENLRFKLGVDERQALKCFREKAIKLGIAPVQCEVDSTKEVTCT